MKNTSRTLLISLMFLFLCLSYGNCSTLPKAKGPDDEKLAGIALGDSISTVTKLLGQPEKKTDAKDEPATGYKVQEYIYKSKGIKVSVDLNSKKVIFLSIESPCKEGTLRGIKIGNTEGKVKSNYILSDEMGKAIDGKKSLAGKCVFCGDIYWGIAFAFDKSGKVKSISMGAFAE